MVDNREVRILMECFLVVYLFCFYEWKFFLDMSFSFTTVSLFIHVSTRFVALIMGIGGRKTLWFKNLNCGKIVIAEIHFVKSYFWTQWKWWVKQPFGLGKEENGRLGEHYNCNFFHQIQQNKNIKSKSSRINNKTDDLVEWFSLWLSPWKFGEIFQQLSSALPR